MLDTGVWLLYVETGQEVCVIERKGKLLVSLLHCLEFIIVDAINTMNKSYSDGIVELDCWPAPNQYLPIVVLISHTKIESAGKTKQLCPVCINTALSW